MLQDHKDIFRPQFKDKSQSDRGHSLKFQIRTPETSRWNCPSIIHIQLASIIKTKVGQDAIARCSRPKSQFLSPTQNSISAILANFTQNSELKQKSAIQVDVCGGEMQLQ